MSYRVLLVGDHRLIREGVKALIERSAEFQVVAEAEAGEDALPLLRRTSPELIVVNVGVPSLKAVEAAKQLGRQSKEARIVMISMLADDDEAIITALHCGASGLVLKGDSTRELLGVLRTVAQGGSCLNGQAPNQLNFHLRDKRRNGRSSVANKLTMRELEVFHLVTAGHNSRDIALQLSLSVETIRSYRKSMMRKLGVKNVAGLIQVGIEAGLTRWTRRPARRHN